MCFDLYADVDLQAVTRAVQDFRLSVRICNRSLVDGYPELPCMYTGALENHLELLLKAAERQRGPLAGNRADVVERGARSG